MTLSIRLGLLLFVALPYFPGLLFLLAGVLNDPHRRLRNAASFSQSEFDRAWAQTRQLYLAGGVVLLVGTLCASFVVWKIARPGPPPEDEETGTGPGDAQT